MPDRSSSPRDVLRTATTLEGVPSALAAARDGIDAVLRDRGLRRTTSAHTTEALLRGAAASARLEGSASSYEELREGTADPVATAAARLNAELLSLGPVLSRAPLQAFARMHVLAATNPDAQDLGRPRSAAAAGLLQELGRLLVGADPAEGAPALAVAAVAHAEVVTAAPFVEANGLVARALERLVLVVRGVDPVSVTVPEAGHLDHEPEYRSALAAYGSGTPQGWRRWLEHAARAYARGAELSPVV